MAEFLSPQQELDLFYSGKEDTEYLHGHDNDFKIAGESFVGGAMNLANTAFNNIENIYDVITPEQSPLDLELARHSMAYESGHINTLEYIIKNAKTMSSDFTPDWLDTNANRILKDRDELVKQSEKSGVGSPNLAKLAGEIPFYLAAIKGTNANMANTRAAIRSNAGSLKTAAAVGTDSLKNALKLSTHEGLVSLGIGKSEEEIEQNIITAGASVVAGTVVTGKALDWIHRISKATGGTGIKPPRANERLIPTAKRYIKKQEKALNDSTSFRQDQRRAYREANKNITSHAPTNEFGRTSKEAKHQFFKGGQVAKNRKIAKETKDRLLAKMHAGIELTKSEQGILAGGGREYIQEITDARVGQGEIITKGVKTPGRARTGGYDKKGNRLYDKNTLLSHYGKNDQRSMVDRIRRSDVSPEAFESEALDAFKVEYNNRISYGNKEASFKKVISSQDKLKEELTYLKEQQNLYRALSEDNRSADNARLKSKISKLDEKITDVQTRLGTDSFESSIDRKTLPVSSQKGYAIKSSRLIRNAKTKRGKSFGHGTSGDKDYQLVYFSDKVKQPKDISKNISTKLNDKEYLDAYKHIEIAMASSAKKFDGDVTPEILRRFPTEARIVKDYAERVHDLKIASKNKDPYELAFREKQRLDDKYSSFDSKLTVKDFDEWNMERSNAYAELGLNVPEYTTKAKSKNKVGSDGKKSEEPDSKTDNFIRESKANAIKQFKKEPNNPSWYSGSAKRPANEVLSELEIKRIKDGVPDRLILGAYPDTSNKVIRNRVIKDNQQDIKDWYRNKNLKDAGLSSDNFKAVDVEFQNEILDASNSVAQIVTYLTGSQSLFSKVIPKGKDFRQNIADNLKSKYPEITKADVKSFYTPKAYGQGVEGSSSTVMNSIKWIKTEAEAKALANDLTKEFAKEVPELAKFMDTIAELYNKSDSMDFKYTLPDGTLMHFKFEGENTFNVYQGKTKIGTFDVPSGTKEEISKALMPKVVQSIDGWIAGDIQKKLNLDTIHDAVITKHGNTQEAKELFVANMRFLNESKYLDKLIKELGGEGYDVKPLPKHLDTDPKSEFLKTEAKGIESSELEYLSKPSKDESIFETTMYHMAAPYYSAGSRILDHMIEQAVHVRNKSMGDIRTGDNVFTRALALALNGQRHSADTLIKAPDNANINNWNNTQHIIVEKLRAKAEMNPNLRDSIKGDRKYFNSNGSVVGSKVSDVREIKQVETEISNVLKKGELNPKSNEAKVINKVIENAKSDAASKTIEDDFMQMLKQMEKEQSEAGVSSTKFDYDSDSFVNRFKANFEEAKRKFNEVNEDSTFRKYQREFIDKALKHFGTDYDSVAKIISKNMKKGKIKAIRAFRAFVNALEKAEAGFEKQASKYQSKYDKLEIDMLNKYDEFVDSIPDDNPILNKFKDGWSDLSSKTSDVSEHISKRMKPEYDKFKDTLKKNYEVDLDVYHNNIKEVGRHLKNKYDYSPEQKQFAKILQYTAPILRLAEEAGDTLTKDIDVLLKGQDQSKWLKHFWETDFSAIKEFQSKAQADEFFKNNINVYNKAKASIDAGAKAIGREENQIGDYLANSNIIAKHYGLEGSEDIIDKLISIKSMSDESWDFISSNRTSNAFNEMLDLSESFKARAKTHFAEDRDMEFIHKGYMQDHYDSHKIFDSDGNVKWDAESREQQGALISDSMSNRVGKFLDKTDKKFIDVENVEDPLKYARENNLKFTSNGFLKVADGKARELAGRKRNLSNMLGNTEASLRRKDAQINALTNILTHDDKTFGKMFSNRPTEGFVALTKNEVRNLPRIARDKILFVNKEWKDKLLGKEEWSFTNAESSQGKKIADRLSKDLVSLFKQNIVLKSASGFKNAMLVNMTSFAVHNGNLLQMHRYSREAYKHWFDFHDVTKAYDRALRSGKMTDEIKNNYRNNEVIQMINDGISINTLDGVRSNGSLMNSMLSDFSGGHFDKFTNEVMFNQNAVSGNAAKQLFSFIDFQGRYMSYKSFKKEGMSGQDAAMRANDLFGQMDELAPDIIDAIDKYGFAIFAKWASSVLPATAKVMKNNPKKSIAISLAALYLGDTFNTNTSSVDPLQTTIDMPIGITTGDSFAWTTNGIVGPKLVPDIYIQAYKQADFYSSDRPEWQRPALLFKNRLEPYHNDGEFVDHRGLVQSMYDSVIKD